jgi:hypothetical protein
MGLEFRLGRRESASALHDLTLELVMHTKFTIALTATLLSGIAFAQEPAPSAPRPSRGQTMESVKAKFGAPTSELAAVGQPPISRWEYPGYVVFFEHDKVLHTVIMK